MPNKWTRKNIERHALLLEYPLNSIVRSKMETLQLDLNKELDSIKELL